MVTEPAIEYSQELLTLFNRAERASAQARRLLDENDRWRRSVMQQLDSMFGLGAEFRRIRNPRASRRDRSSL
jgi:hypothetical protein